MRRAVELARSWSELRGPVVIYGERGAGRAHLAEFMHRTGPRSEGRFEVVRASELPGGAAEPLLFGCEPSVLPGIDAVLPGILERVDGGALFLDDIGDLAAALQVKLVRALQEGRYFRVGGTRPVPMDVRLYAGSRRDLADAVKEGGLREDLDGLLGGMRVTVPPLRMRLADIQGLVARFVRAFELEHGLRCPALSPAASGMLEGYGWPGNVAELKHVLRRLLIRAADDEVSGPLVEAELAALPWGEGAGDPERCKRIAEAERELLSAAMGRSRGRLARAAHLLELDRASLDRALAMHGIDPIPG
jgi:DNA-binding NtrC family response regulator